jgi:hypothetical protein
MAGDSPVGTTAANSSFSARSAPRLPQTVYRKRANRLPSVFGPRVFGPRVFGPRVFGPGRLLHLDFLHGLVLDFLQGQTELIF